MRTLSPCCYILNQDHAFGNTISEYFDSSELNKLKQDFLDGKKPERCKACWMYEDNDITSHRQMIQSELPPNYNYKIDGLDRLQIQFHNNCNLACHMCGSWNSSKWRKEAKIYNDNNGPHSPVNAAFNNLTDVLTINEFKQHIRNVRKILISGGEPFCHPSLIDIIKTAKYLGIENVAITTNGSLVNDKAIKELFNKYSPKFKKAS